MPPRAATCSYCGAAADHSPDRALLARLGSRVEELTGGSFEVDGLVGCGPHGCTFRARDSATGAEVALKFARLAAGLAAETARRLGDSLGAAAAVGHPRILAASTLQRTRDDAVFWTTPLVSHGHGADRLLADGASPPSLGTISALVTDVADALGAAHARGVPHLALTPSKLVLDGGGRAFVADLGVALGFRGGTSLSGTGGAERAAYAAPEQWHGAVADGHADQYALAVMTYELLTGRRVVESGSVGTLALLPPIEVPSDAHLRPDVPLHVNAALRRALSKRPEHRFATIGEFAQATAGQLDITPASLPTIHPVLDLPRRRRSWVGATVTTSILLLAAAAYFGPWRYGQGPLARGARTEAARATARREAEVARGGQRGAGGGGGGGAGAAGEATVATPATGGEAPSAPAYINVTAGGRAAVVVVDGTPRGVAPVTVRVSPGSHTVTLRGGGFAGASRSVTTTAGGTAQVEFTAPGP